MNIGIPKERRSFEFRVGMTPVGVQQLTEAGHICYVEHDAGLGAGFSDQDYEQAGGHIVFSSHEAFGRADLILKVARPLYEELEWIQPETIIAGLLHLASARQDKIAIFQEKRLTAIALEQLQTPDGSMPVRHPLAQIGGRLAAQIGARLLQNNAEQVPSGGKGVLLGGIAGVPPAEVVVIGAGVAGTCAIRGFAGMGAHVTVLDTSLNALEIIYEKTPSIVTMVSNPRNIARACAYADVVVGAILVAGERPPIVVTREMVRSMKPRSVIMDLSIDEGGCVETSRPTTHEHSYFIEEGVIHYCVPNIPSVVARTSTYAYTNAAIPFILDIADRGIETTVAENFAIEKGTSIHKGKLHNIARLKPKSQE
jgi:alanine dehydrogenase